MQSSDDILKVIKESGYIGMHLNHLDSVWVDSLVHRLCILSFIDYIYNLFCLLVLLKVQYCRFFERIYYVKEDTSNSSDLSLNLTVIN